MGRLTGKSAIITGGTSGIGEAATRLFVQEGGKVAFIGRSEERGAKIETALGNAAKFIHANLHEADEIERSFRDSLNFLGNADILVNNAGIHLGRGTIEEVPMENFDALIRIDLMAAIYYMKLVIPIMRKQEKGSIVNVSSINGLRGVYKRPDYTVAKGALTALTRQVALDYAKYGIRVNDVAFGLVITSFSESDTRSLGENEMKNRISKIPMQKACTPEEAARSILFLASDESGFITGTTLTVDGGVTSAAYV